MRIIASRERPSRDYDIKLLKIIEISGNIVLANKLMGVQTIWMYISKRRACYVILSQRNAFDP